jgi:hypothetical protein
VKTEHHNTLRGLALLNAPFAARERMPALREKGV